MKTNCDEYPTFDYSKKLIVCLYQDSTSRWKFWSRWVAGVEDKSSTYRSAKKCTKPQLILRAIMEMWVLRLWTRIGWCKDTRRVKIWLVMYEDLLLRKWRESVKGDSGRLKRDFFAIIAPMTFSQCSQNEWEKKKLLQVNQHMLSLPDNNYFDQINYRRYETFLLLLSIFFHISSFYCVTFQLRLLVAKAKHTWEIARLITSSFLKISSRLVQFHNEKFLQGINWHSAHKWSW